jgi:hypothetical protein
MSESLTLTTNFESRLGILVPSSHILGTQNKSYRLRLVKIEGEVVRWVEVDLIAEL